MRKHLLISGLCCGLAFALLAPAALAQTTTGQTTDHERIKALEARVAALERRLNMAPATPQPVPHRQPSPTAAPTPATSPHQSAATATVPPAPSDWSQLHRGMDSREVIALIGPPERRLVRPMSETWLYPDDRQVEFDRNNLLQSWSKP